MASDYVPPLAFRPKADATVLACKLPPPPEYPKAVGPIYDRENYDNPILAWPLDAEKTYYPAREPYAPATIPDQCPTVPDRYLRAFLAKNERLRLSMLWYYTCNIFNEIEFLSGLQEKLCIAQESTGWDFAIVGTLDLNYYTRLATIGVPLGILPRGETLCAHTVSQPPGSVFLLPNLMEDWRFADCPYVESGGLQAYAGAPLRLQNESGDIVCLGSLCVASSTPQDPLTRMQQATLVRLADWIVADIVQLTRARRQRDRRHMVDLIAAAQKQASNAKPEEAFCHILRTVYPGAVVSLQSSNDGLIEVEGRSPVVISSFSDDMWEDIDHIDDLIANSNHLELPSDRVVRVIAAPCESVLGHSYLTVGSKDFRLVFDDIDAWFVQTCAGMISQMWHKHLLEEVMLAKEKFLRGFSHQLRTPVHGILGSVELLAEELNARSLNETVEQAAAMLRATSVNAPSKESKIYLDTIKRAGSDLISIINSMITLNRWADVATTERPYATHPIYDLEKALADETLKIVSGDTRYNASIIFNHTLPPDCCTLRTDIILLRDSLLPLIINAIQNTMEGIVVITISAHPHSHELVVDVRDTGRGIPVKDQKRIFELYEQVDVYSTGAGLGLTLACRFAALLNGSVELVSSEVDRGSHFRATFQGLDILHSNSPLLAEPLVPQFTRLPRRYHLISSCPRTSLGDQFTNFLACYGLTASDSAEGAFIVVDYSTDLEQHRAIVSQYPSDQVILCLVPYPEGEVVLEPTAENIIYIHGPFLTPKMSLALTQADQFLSMTHTNQDKATEQDDHTRPSDVRESASKDVVNTDMDKVTSTGATSTGTLNSILSDAQAIPEFTEADQKCVTHKMLFTTAAESIEPTEEELSGGGSSGSRSAVNGTALPPAEKLQNLHSGATVSAITSTTHPMALLVDDNAINLRVMQMYCSKRNLPYVCAKDGLEAVSIFRSYQESAVLDKSISPIQLVLMDLQMPNCDGVEATKQIRQLENEHGWGQSVLFVVTGQDSAADRKAVDEAGGQEYFVKPVSIKSLDAGLKQYFPRFKVSSGS